MSEYIKNATDLIEQGHVRVGTDVIKDPAFLVSRTLEDFVTWVDSSKIRKHVMEYNDMVRLMVASSHIERKLISSFFFLSERRFRNLGGPGEAWLFYKKIWTSKINVGTKSIFFVVVFFVVYKSCHFGLHNLEFHTGSIRINAKMPPNV